MEISRRGTLIASLSAIAGASRPASAQSSWPSRPVRVLVPYPAGGTTDVTVRTVASVLQGRLGQPFVVENRPGATGSIGMEAAARASPDGYTLVAAADSAIFLPFLRPELPYHPLRDFAPVAVLVQQPIVVAAHPSLNVRTLPDLVALARTRPNGLDYVTAGTASTHHLVASLFSQRAQIRMTHIPYRGGGQAINDLVGGQVPVGFLGSAPIVPQARAGRLVMLAVSSGSRSPNLPEVPTIAEQGYPGFDLPQWFGLFSPAGTPRGIVDRLQAEVVAALGSAEVRKVLADAALDPVGGTAEAMRRRITSEATLWADSARSLGVVND
jgi:tripartite-type tricarboxylate transporter receptor subunit TctC